MSAAKTSKRVSHALFYIGEDGEPTDEGLHDEMLDEHPGPHASSVKQLRDLGFDDDTIKTFLDVKRLPEDDGEESIADFNPNHGPDGRFSSGSGGGRASAPEKGSGSGGGGSSRIPATHPDRIKARLDEAVDHEGYRFLNKFAKTLSERSISANKFLFGMIGPYGTSDKPWMNNPGGNAVEFMTNLTKDGKEVAEMIRAIDFNRDAAEHISLQVKDSKQGSGLNKPLAKSQVGLYRQMGLKKVNISAGDTVGGYAWARYGYVPSAADWKNFRHDLSDEMDWGDADTIPQKAKDELNKILKSDDPEAIRAIADSKYGFKLLGGSNWSGTLDLENPKTMRRFNTYVSGRLDREK